MCMYREREQEMFLGRRWREMMYIDIYIESRRCFYVDDREMMYIYRAGDIHLRGEAGEYMERDYVYIVILYNTLCLYSDVIQYHSKDLTVVRCKSNHIYTALDSIYSTDLAPSLLSLAFCLVTLFRVLLTATMYCCRHCRSFHSIIH